MACQQKSSEIVSKFFQANFNDAIETSSFPEQLKYGDVKPIFKKDFELTKTNTDQSVSFLMYLKFIKGVLTSNSRKISI